MTALWGVVFFRVWPVLAGMFPIVVCFFVVVDELDAIIGHGVVEAAPAGLAYDIHKCFAPRMIGASSPIAQSRKKCSTS